jgi:hypothetical protein
MFFRWSPFDSKIGRLVISIATVFHLFMLSMDWISQRGTSVSLRQVQDRFATYLALGNWRADTTPLSIASAAQLGERIQVEVHRTHETSDAWETLAISQDDFDQASTNFYSSAIRLAWIRQLNGLLFYELEEPITRLLREALVSDPGLSRKPIDGIRVRVAPRISQDQVAALQASGERIDWRDMSDAEVFYAASIVDLGDGQISFLPKLEERRASKSLSRSSNDAGASKP